MKGRVSTNCHISPTEIIINASNLEQNVTKKLNFSRKLKKKFTNLFLKTM